MELTRKVWTGKVIDAPKDKPIVAVVSTQEPDLVGDVIYQGPNDKGKGWVLDGYNGRGRVYWMHDPFRPNLGKAQAQVDGGRLLLHVKFDPKDEFAAEIDRKYREGYLSEWSVGFMPSEGKYEKNKHGGYDFFEQRLDEVSAVNQGAHPGTATLSKSLHEIADHAAEIRSMIDGFERRLREVEAAVMRGETEKAEARVRAILSEVNQIRSRA